MHFLEMFNSFRLAMICLYFHWYQPGLEGTDTFLSIWSVNSDVACSVIADETSFLEGQPEQVFSPNWGTHKAAPGFSERFDCFSSSPTAWKGNPASKVHTWLFPHQCCPAERFAAVSNPWHCRDVDVLSPPSLLFICLSPAGSCWWFIGLDFRPH